MAKLPEITLVGHPFAPIGMGEHVRSAFRAWKAVYVTPRVLDIYRMNTPDPDVAAELDNHVADRLNTDVQIFHINGDEVAQAVAHIARRTDKRGKRIIYPAWELPRYPDVWARELEKFDEVWAQSHYTYASLSKAVRVPVVHMPESCEVQMSSLLSRRYFNIPETTYVFLFFFDFASFVERKNPYASLLAFEHFLRRHPSAASTFVVKLNGSAKKPDALQEFRERISSIAENVHVIDRIMSDNEVKNLVRCCDCFVSLHRAEGFGRGISESMRLGKPVIATGYSGNMDFMSNSNSLPVGHELVRVPPDAYPHWEDQVWAEPDIEQASGHMEAVYSDPDYGRKIGYRASLDMQREFSYLAAGSRYRRRLEELCE